MTTTDRLPISNFQRTNKKYQEFKKSNLDTTPFPYLFKHSDAFNIMVEVYEITEDKLKELDMIEGVPHHYIRDKVEVILNRNRINCFIYFINEKELNELGI
jgi:gamma-glutamylcyclotransferase (GGCT)/AIG2-like uncharacterized protein YtfP